MKRRGSFRRSESPEGYLAPSAEPSVSCRRCGVPMAMDARLRGRAAASGRTRPDGSIAQHAARAGTAHGGLCDRCLAEAGVTRQASRSRRLTRPTKGGRRKAIAYARRYRREHYAVAPRVAAAAAARADRARAQAPAQPIRRAAA